jgi:hypothetical protein
MDYGHSWPGTWQNSEKKNCLNFVRKFVTNYSCKANRTVNLILVYYSTTSSVPNEVRICAESSLSEMWELFKRTVGVVNWPRIIDTWSCEWPYSCSTYRPRESSAVRPGPPGAANRKAQHTTDTHRHTVDDQNPDVTDHSSQTQFAHTPHSRVVRDREKCTMHRAPRP